MPSSYKIFLSHLGFLVLFQFKAYSQIDSTMIDPRDGQSYQITNIDGDVWMLENLNWETKLSFGIPDTLKALNPNYKARWYHMNEIDSVCPSGWRLPQVDDWIGYFDYLSLTSKGDYKLKTWETDYRLTEFNQYFDLFENGNPLMIIGAGIYQGDDFVLALNSADFWIMDIKTRKESPKKKYKVVDKSVPGTAHIHLFNEFTHIHSHDHHLDPNKPQELRRFMCRCIKENE